MSDAATVARPQRKIAPETRKNETDENEYDPTSAADATAAAFERRLASSSAADVVLLAGAVIERGLRTRHTRARLYARQNGVGRVVARTARVRIRRKVLAAVGTTRLRRGDDNVATLPSRRRRRLHLPLALLARFRRKRHDGRRRRRRRGRGRRLHPKIANVLRRQRRLRPTRGRDDDGIERRVAVVVLLRADDVLLLRLFGVLLEMDVRSAEVDEIFKLVPLRRHHSSFRNYFHRLVQFVDPVLLRRRAGNVDVAPVILEADRRQRRTGRRRRIS